jgi:hypothetical protein
MEVVQELQRCQHLAKREAAEQGKSQRRAGVRFRLPARWPAYIVCGTQTITLWASIDAMLVVTCEGADGADDCVCLMALRSEPF